MPTDPTSTLGVTVIKASPDGGKKGLSNINHCWC